MLITNDLKASRQCVQACNKANSLRNDTRNDYLENQGCSTEGCSTVVVEVIGAPSWGILYTSVVTLLSAIRKTSY